MIEIPARVVVVVVVVVEGNNTIIARRATDDTRCAGVQIGWSRGLFQPLTSNQIATGYGVVAATAAWTGDWTRQNRLGDVLHR
jgi:hypothetical protein